MTPTPPTTHSTTRFLLVTGEKTIVCPDLAAATQEAIAYEAEGAPVILVSVRSGVRRVLYATEKQAEGTR